jgi:molybdopterin-dependent oxidoreductase alpha subunit
MSQTKSNGTRLSRFVPFGLAGQPKPRYLREILGALWENKTELSHAWNILNHGVCDGCALGPYGLRDNVHEGVHLCTTRLKLLKLNTMGALDVSVMNDIGALRQLRQEKLRSLGRLPYPMLRRRGEKGFTRIAWDKAVELATRAIRNAAPNQMGFFATSRGLTNEVYYVFQKLARVLGTNNVDLCSRLCHAASDSALKATLGNSAPTCSLSDFIGTEILVIFGSDLANNQPMTTKYLHLAKQQGTRIIVVNPMREHGLERYWVPSVPSSALFGTRLMDDFYQVRVGGDIAFVNGVLKALLAADQVHHRFIADHTSRFDEMKAAIDQQRWEILEQRSGVTRNQMIAFAQLYGTAQSAVFVYGTGLTQHEFGTDNVKAIVNLALARGMLGREKCGIMPLRGHSGIQGGADCGAEPDKFPGGFAVDETSARRFSNLWKHPIPSTRGLKLPNMIEAAYHGELQFLYSIGGNLLETMPDRNFVAAALERVPVRIHQDILLNSSMLLDSAEAVLILPGQTRYEQRGGGTSTSTERRVRFSPEISSHRIGESLPEWEIPVLIGRKAMPNGDLLFAFDNTQSIREEMGRVMPIYHGIEKLTKEGDHLQWGGPFLFKDGFTNMPGNRAVFTPLEPPDRRAPAGKFYLTTRRGKQFNSMIFSNTDPLMGTTSRRSIFISPDDADHLELEDGYEVTLRSDAGKMKGIIHLAPVKRGTLQAYWPEANVLIGPRFDPVSAQPDYNVEVWIEKDRA